MNKPSIVFLPSWYPGPEDPVSGIFVQQQARALALAGLKISIFTVAESRIPIRSVYSYREEDQLPVYRLRAFVPPKRIRPLRGWWYRKWEQLLQQYVDRRGVYPDLLHAHGFVGGAAARHLGKKYAIPYVITEHYDGFISGKLPAHWRRDLANIYEDAAGVIAVSASLAEAMAAYCTNVEVIPNMIDMDLFRPAVPLPQHHGPKRIISVGSLVPRKDPELLLQVFARVREKIPVELVLVGDGPLRRKLEQLAFRLGIRQAVHFTGTLQPEEVAAQLQQAHLYVSTSQSESFALAPVEALACGVPVVMLKCGSVLEGFQTKMVSLQDRKDALEAAIIQQLGTALVLEKRDMRRYIENQFAPQVIVSLLQSIYEKYGK